MKVLIVYDTSTGNTEKMAHAVEDGVKKAGVEVVFKHVDEASVDEIPQCQGLYSAHRYIMGYLRQDQEVHR